jgi:hypothetical protein
LVVLVAVQLSVMGLYLPPLIDGVADGVGLAVVIVVRVCVGPDETDCAQDLSPLVKSFEKKAIPPHTIISLPLQIAVWRPVAAGTFVRVVAVQVLVLALYLPPVLTAPLSLYPPQTIIWLPVQTAV